jgi:hypothetical protein
MSSVRSGGVSRQGTVSPWLVLAVVVPVVFSGLGLMAGFGLGTLCTNDPAHVGGLESAPCNVVTRGVVVNLGAQAGVFALAIAAAWLPRRSREAAWFLVGASTVAFISSMAFAGSY